MAAAILKQVVLDSTCRQVSVRLILHLCSTRYLNAQPPKVLRAHAQESWYGVLPFPRVFLCVRSLRTGTALSGRVAPGAARDGDEV